VARRDLGTPPGERFTSVPGEMRKLLIWTSYSVQPKRTALYRLDPATRRFEPLLDLPSAGDTAFPSVARLSPHEFLIANYSSAFEHGNRSWLWGQLNGTGIYLVRLRFEPGAASPLVVASGPHGVAAPLALAAFGDDWPRPDRLGPRLAFLGAVSLGALAIAHHRRRRAKSTSSIAA
jgi:hypothetical protein